MLSPCSFCSLHRTRLSLPFLPQDHTTITQFYTTLYSSGTSAPALGLPAPKVNSPASSALLLRLLHTFSSHLLCWQAVADRSYCSQRACGSFDSPWHMRYLFLASVSRVQMPKTYFHLRSPTTSNSSPTCRKLLSELP